MRWDDCFSSERFLRHIKREHPLVIAATVLAVIGWAVLFGYSLYMGTL